MEALQRTQIYLTRGEIATLEKLKKATGISASELVRRAVDRVYLGRESLSRDERLAVAQSTAGAWTDRRETGAAFVERLRSGRLARSRARRG
jgi:hypothetical protein